MTSLVFANKEETSFKGCTATHWTKENMKHCSYIQGHFSTDIVQAAKEGFRDSYTSRDGEECEYIDGEGLLSGDSTCVKVWGLVKSQDRYYWNGETKTVNFQTIVDII